MSWSLDKQQLMYFSCIPTYTLSIIGSAFIIINFISFSSLRTFSYKLVFFIAISDMLRAIAMIMPAYYNEDLNTTLCWVQSILGNMSGLSTALWNCSVAHSIKSLFTAERVEPNKLFYKYLIINTVITILLSIPPIFPLNNHSYGLAGQWCWIKDDSVSDSIMRIVCQYSAEVICGVYIIYVYWHFMRKLFQTSSNISEARFQKMNETIGRLKWFPFVLIISWVPGIINRFSQIITKGDATNYQLTFTQYASISICGLLDSLIYAWTKPVKKQYSKLFPEAICCWNRHRHDPIRALLNQPRYKTFFLARNLDDTLSDGAGVTPIDIPSDQQDTYNYTMTNTYTDSINR